AAKVFLLLPPSGAKRAAHAAATLGPNQRYIDQDAISPTDQLIANGLAGSASWRSGDGLHPNARAHAEMAARLAQAVLGGQSVATGLLNQWVAATGDSTFIQKVEMAMLQTCV